MLSVLHQLRPGSASPAPRRSHASILYLNSLPPLSLLNHPAIMASTSSVSISCGIHMVMYLLPLRSDFWGSSSGACYLAVAGAASIFTILVVAVVPPAWYCGHESDWRAQPGAYLSCSPRRLPLRLALDPLCRLRSPATWHLHGHLCPPCCSSIVGGTWPYGVLHQSRSMPYYQGVQHTHCLFGRR